MQGFSDNHHVYDCRSAKVADVEFNLILMSKRFIFIIALVAFAAFEGFYYSRNMQKSASDSDYQKAFLRVTVKLFNAIWFDFALDALNIVLKSAISSSVS